MPSVKKISRENSPNRAVGRRGFTLIEMLLSAVLGGMLLSVVAFIFANLASSFAEQPSTNHKYDWATDGTDYISMSPAYSQLPAAFSLQAEIMSVMQTDIVGSGSLSTLINLAGSSGSPVSAIFVVSSDAGDKLPTAADADIDPDPAWLEGVTANKLASSAQFYELLDDNEPLSVPDGVTVPYGFSVYFISSTGHISLLIHCRRWTDADAGIYVYMVYAYLDGTFSSSLSYAYGLKIIEDEDNDSPVRPYTRRFSLREDDDWGIHDELGTYVVFPDPTELPYQIASGDGDKVRTYSRFSTFLPVNP